MAGGGGNSKSAGAQLTGDYDFFTSEEKAKLSVI